MPSKDNKTKDYISPITLDSKDLFDIKKKGAENALGKQEEIGIFEFVEETYQKTYPRDLHAFIERVAKVRRKDFWVVVGFKEDKLLNALWQKNQKMILIDVQACPTPMPGMHVYHYSQASGDYKLLWTLPDDEFMKVIEYNYLELKPIIPDLINDYERYKSGELHRLSDKLNGIDRNAFNKDPKSRMIIKINDNAIETDTYLKDSKKGQDVRHNGTNSSSDL